MSSCISIKLVKGKYLTRPAPLTDEGFVHWGEGGGVVVNVQHLYVDRNTAALTGITWEANRLDLTHFLPSASASVLLAHPALLKDTLVSDEAGCFYDTLKLHWFNFELYFSFHSPHSNVNNLFSVNEWLWRSHALNYSCTVSFGMNLYFFSLLDAMCVRKPLATELSPWWECD